VEETALPGKDGFEQIREKPIASEPSRKTWSRVGRRGAESKDVSEATFPPISLKASPVEIELPNGGIVRLPLGVGEAALIAVIEAVGNRVDKYGFGGRLLDGRRPLSPTSRRPSAISICLRTVLAMPGHAE
jgi:hypothetical protein